MSDVVNLVLSREPETRYGFDLPERGIRLEPADASKTKIGSKTVGRDAAEAVLPRSVLRQHAGMVVVPKEFLTKGAQRSYSSTFDQTYFHLKEAIEAKRADAVDEVSLGVLARHPIPDFAALDRDTQRVFRFFDANGCKVTAAELGAFMATFQEDDLAEFLKGVSEQVDILRAQILASMAQGQLGDTPYNLIDMMKYLIVFQMAAIWHLRGEFSGDKEVPIELVCRIVEAPVFLPDFMFFDPCHWGGKVEGDRKTGAVSKTVAHKRAYEARMAQKREAAEKGDTQDSDDCECSCESICLPPDPCCADINFYVADTLVLRDKTTCYLPGELAYVENVAAREERVRTHEFATTIETYSEEEETSTRSEERDHTVTDRSTVQNEIEKDISASLDVQARYGSKKNYVMADAHLSRDVAQREAREKMREAVTRAVTSLQVQKRKLTSRRVTTQETETNSHTFDNTGSDKPVVEKYFYVNREVEGQVYSHGLAGQVELLIPSPAALYEHLQMLKDSRAFDMEKPPKPTLKPTEITPGKYEHYITEHGLYDLEPPKPQPADTTMSIPITREIDGDRDWNGVEAVTIPDGYTATKITMSGVIMHHKTANANRHRLTVDLGAGSVNQQGDVIRPKDNVSQKLTDTISETGTVQLGLVTLGLRNFTCLITLTLKADTVDNWDWQMTVYKAIMAQYEADMQAYEDALAAHNRQMEDDKFGEHPFTLKEIILAELKRAAIYMMCEDFERDGVMNMKSEPCGYPEINRSTAADQLWDQYFWDRAFDWEHMSFIFFDYFWNSMCEWPEKFNPDHDNQMFKAFKRAGYARVTVPCAAGMDADVLWYTQTRQKWGPGGTLPLNPSDPRWNSIVAELKHSKDCFQNDREGNVLAILDTSPTPAVATHQLLLQGSSRYWDAFLNMPDTLGAIAYDLNREIFVDGGRYKLQGITQLPANSPLFDGSLPASEQWVITLDRPFEGSALQDPSGAVYPSHAHAIGALYVGAPFRWQEPTTLVWIGDHNNNCLPCYPVTCE